MCVSQRPWTGCRGLASPALPLVLLLLLPLSFLSSTPPLAQGAITIPDGYKAVNMSQPPKMMDMPSPHTAFFPEDIALPCEATGNPTPTFRWVKDGETFGPERTGSGTLKASEGELLDVFDGEFQCYASNKHGTAMTKTVRVVVETQPVLLKQHKIRVEAFEGDSIVLSCSPPKSSVPPHIHWMDKKLYHIKQSDRVLVGLDGNLYFSNVLRSDTRDDYICNAQYPAARTILPETSVSLTVRRNNDVPHEKRPHLFTPKGSHTSVLALREQSITLECIPKGLPTPKVEWKKKDGNLDDTGAQLDNHNRWLRFDRITEEDDGEYECRAFNSHGSVSHSFTVSVEAEPYWVKEPQNLIYAPGETVRLDCQAEGIPTPTVTWRINGEPITEVDDEPRRSVLEGVLILRDVVYSDTAVYQCEATNKHGSILLNTFLHVVKLDPKILSSDGVRYQVTEGGDIMLHCESFGSPRPRVTWLDEVERPLLSHPRVSLLTNGTIKLSEASHEDSGSYTCSVDNTNINITAHLDVFNQTTILTSPQDVRVLRGTDALLDCSFFIDPRLDRFQIEWKKNGHELLESSPHRYSIFKNGTLKVMNVQSGDNAQFTCEVSTKLDNAKATGSITVVARPDPPKDLTLTDIQDHSLTLSWIPGSSHNSPIVEFIVEVSEEQHSESGKWEVLETVPGDFNHRQLKLHPYCTYRFRVVAVNEMGHSEPSLPSEHRSTPPAVPSGNPENVRSESTDPKTLTITWDEMEKHLHNGQDFQYKVSWRKSGGSSVHWEEAYVLGPPFQVNDTGTYTPFEIKVQAVNSLGAGPEPEPEIGHSGEDKPEEAPTGVSTAVMNSTVRVKWNEAQNVRGKLKGYKIYIRRLGPQGGRVRRSLGNPHHEEEKGERSERGRERHRDTREVMVHGTKTWEEVMGLQLFSRFELSMTAVNSKGEGPHSTPHRFVTPEGAPGPPASLTFESPTEKSLILFWTPPVHTNGILKDYVVLYQQESKNSPLKMEMISDASVTHIELENLDPSSHYIFKVIARTAAGEGPPITRRGATLLEGVPPSNVSITPENTSLNLSWVPGERYRNHGFTVRYARKCPGCDWEESEVVNSSQGFYSLKGLKPGTNYKLEIKLGNETQWKDETMTLGPEPSEMPGGFATQGWLIGLISAIILLVLILLILCLIKRRKGGKYAVKDKEDKEVDSEARPMKDETFGEYRSLESDADEKRSDSQPSLCGESKLGSDDSLAEYGDSVDIQFNEDGSFIGQYSGRGPVPHGNESSGPASPVNPVPPPPIAPSMSSILNRPS